jgi:hypothetical protein
MTAKSILIEAGLKLLGSLERVVFQEKRDQVGAARTLPCRLDPLGNLI